MTGIDVFKRLRVDEENTDVYVEKRAIFTTDNPLYTDTRYNDNIRYNDNLTVTKPSHKRKHLATNYARMLY